jgi:hypothetical protein
VNYSEGSKNTRLLYGYLTIATGPSKQAGSYFSCLLVDSHSLYFEEGATGFKINPLTFNRVNSSIFQRGSYA